MRKLNCVRFVAAVAIAGSALAGAVVATSSSAGAAKSPVPATCTSLSGSTTVAIEVGGSASSLLSGCTSTSTKVTTSAVDVSTLNATLNGGTGTIYWTGNKITTYSYSVAATTGLSCGTFLNLAASGQETITFSGVAGTAKVTAGGTGSICYWNTSDGSVYERSVGSVTI